MVAVEKCALRDYEVVILDLDMPIMSGYEACKKIREKEGQGGIKDLLHIDYSLTKEDLKPAKNRN